ncbi:acyl-CoA thioesterase [Actinomadura fulvescens]|uniref:Thioesterase domain-containing protein n=1 Tax=Actinomadura fulvescens TaxID=46160 RepID=A0ABP6CIM4_9ACTN
MGSLRIARYRVEHVDTDAAGVVHFTRYASWFESAVLENLDGLGLGLGVAPLAERDLVPAVTELTMKYVRSARFMDRIEVRVRVAHVGGASFRFAGEVRHGDEPLIAGAESRTGGDDAPGPFIEDRTLLAAGTLAWCLVNGTGGAAARLPGPFREKLRDHMEESAR